MRAAEQRSAGEHGDSGNRIAIVLFIFFAVCYGYFFGGGGWNQNSTFALTRAIVEDRSFRIDRFFDTTGDVSIREGHLYSNKSPGLAFLAVPFYAALRGIELVAGVDPSTPHLVTLNAWICTWILCGIPGAMIPVLLFKAGLRSRLSARDSIIVALLIGLGTPLFGFSTLLFAHVPSAFFLLASFLHLRERSDAAALITSGLLAGLAGMTNYLAIPVVALFAVRAAMRSGGVRLSSAARFLAGASVPLLLLAFYQKVSFGGLFTTPLDTMNPAFVSQRALFLGVIELPSLEALIGITISPYRGLFFVSPFLVIALGGLAAMLRDRERRVDSITVLLTILMFVGFNTTFNGWDGGFSFGPRYLIPIIPFLGLAALHAIHRLLPLWIVLGVISVANNFAATAVDPQPSASVRHPLRDYIYPLLLEGSFDREMPMVSRWSSDLYHGHTSVNRQTMTEIVPFLKSRPGSPQSEWASFNLGETVFRPGQPWSLFPIALWMIAVPAWLLRNASRSPADARASSPLSQPAG
jgi:hypothetical protein